MKDKILKIIKKHFYEFNNGIVYTGSFALVSFGILNRDINDLDMIFYNKDIYEEVLERYLWSDVDYFNSGLVFETVIDGVKVHIHYEPGDVCDSFDVRLEEGLVVDFQNPLDIFETKLDYIEKSMNPKLAKHLNDIRFFIKQVKASYEKENNSQDSM